MRRSAAPRPSRAPVPQCPRAHAANSRSASTSSASCRTNHGSIWVSSATRPVERPASKARLTWKMRSGVGCRSAAPMVVASSFSSRSSAGVAPTTQPSRSISRARMPFWNASLNVRPMAMDSPTDFICVLSRQSASGNFS